MWAYGDYCKEEYRSWFQESAISQAVWVGRKSYEELARSTRSSGAPFVTLSIKGVFCKDEGDADLKEGVKKETPLIGNLNFKLAEYLTEGAL